MTPSLDTIRGQIDALDAKLRDLLGARADLIAQVAAAKSEDAHGASLSLRPAREAQLMRVLVAYAHDNNLPVAALIAVWREIIGMAIIRQGGMKIFTAAQNAPLARDYFGAVLEVTIGDVKPKDFDTTMVGVLPLDDIPAPEAGLAVFGLLPLLGVPQAVLYGAVPHEEIQQPVTLVGGSKLPDNAHRLSDNLALLDGAVEAPAGCMRFGIFEAPLEHRAK